MSVERLAVDVAGERLCLVLHVPDTAGRVPCVVACHGLGASKDSDKYLMLGAELPAAGFALARFDFRGCGESTGVEADTTIATRIADVEAVLARLAPHPRLSGVFGLLGSSLGGFVALHVAARAHAGDRPAAAGVRAVVTWNAPAHLGQLAEDARAGQPGVGRALREEVARHRYDRAPAGVARHLVVQGDMDDVVRVEHATALHARGAEPCELVLVAGGDHRLTEPAHRRQAVEVSAAWFERFVAGATVAPREGGITSR